MSLTIKQRAQEVIAALHEDATWQDLLYAFELRGDVQAGLADVMTGRVIDTDELRRRFGLRQ
jgi:hypothetical protein